MNNIIKFPPKPKLRPLEIGIVCQARMGSTRFPGKSMAPLLGKPVVQWVLERAKQIRTPKKANSKVILAVPDQMESEPMLLLADKLGVENSLGSELNVLKRYYDTARFFNLDIIMRITCDCPFIDPIVCDGVLQLLMWRKLDYTSNVFPRRTFQRGLDCECFTMDALEAAYKLSDKLGDWEHVTPWMQRTNEVKKGNFAQKINMSHINLCVDFPEDIQRLEQMAKNTVTLSGANENAIKTSVS